MLSTKKQQTWIPGIINEFLHNDWVAKMSSSSPAINIMECDKRFRVEICAPGMSKDDFTIEVKNDNQLEITMQRKCGVDEPVKDENSDEQEEGNPQVHKQCDWDSEKAEDLKHGRYLCREFTYSHFRQTLILPDSVDKGKITAKQENGILTIIIPKKDSYIEAQATKIIKVE